MVLEARIRFRHDGDVSSILEDGERIVHVAGDARRCIATIHARDAAHVDEFIHRLAPLVDTDRVLSRTETSAIVGCRCPQHGVVADLGAMGAVVRWPVIHEGGYKWYDLMVESREPVRRIIEHLARLGEATLVHVRSADADSMSVALNPSDLTGRLTPKQREALRLAIQRGYYESPRRTDLESLAAEMGVARSTFQEHLQKAEQTVVHKVADIWERFPSLLA